MDNFLKNYQQAQKQINSSLNTFLKKYKKPAALYKPTAYVVATGGKRIRPILTLWACGACGGNIPMALPAANAIELFHTFTLVHDDIMDKAALRRGYPTINSSQGVNTAILAGDTLLGLAYNSLQNLPKKNISEAAKILTRALITVCEGQSDDEESGKLPSQSLASYYSMINKKTSALLEAAVGLGALVAGAARTKAKALQLFAREVGLGFQIQDDALDLSNSALWGKEFGKDLKNGKKGILFILAQKYITAADKKVFARACKKMSENKNFKKTAQLLKNIFIKYSIQERAQKMSAAHYEKARHALSSLPPSRYRTNLVDLTFFLQNRQA